jgi:hypothetical protein
VRKSSRDGVPSGDFCVIELSEANPISIFDIVIIAIVVIVSIYMRGVMRNFGF